LSIWLLLAVAVVAASTQGEVVLVAIAVLLQAKALEVEHQQSLH
jgi:hypothetical protein